MNGISLRSTLYAQFQGSGVSNGNILFPHNQIAANCKSEQPKAEKNPFTHHAMKDNRLDIIGTITFPCSRFKIRTGIIQQAKRWLLKL